MNYLKEKYINYLSNRLLLFKKKREGLYNFRCPICLDSQKSAHKARAYLVEKDNDVWFKCWNCDAPIGNFDNFLRHIDTHLYNDYIREKYGKSDYKEPEIKKQVKYYNTDCLDDLKIINQLSEIDPMRVYVQSRKIPEYFYDKLYDCQYFKKFTNTLIPNMFNEQALCFEERRLLIPFFDENKKLFAYSGRSLDIKNDLRYINIVLDDTKPKIFGLDRWKKNELTFVVEGPIDSMFLSNCIATAGGSLISYFRNYNKNNLIIVFDNEPHSKFTKEKMKKAIEEGFNVCIWPFLIKFKDINEGIFQNYSSLNIEEIIKTNTFKGLEASLKLKFW